MRTPLSELNTFTCQACGQTIHAVQTTTMKEPTLATDTGNPTCPSPTAEHKVIPTFSNLVRLVRVGNRLRSNPTPTRTPTNTTTEPNPQ